MRYDRARRSLDRHATYIASTFIAGATRPGWLACGRRLSIDDLLNLPITVYPTAALGRRAWELRDNASAYDACYVALAEALGCSLATADQRLAHAPGARCKFEIV